MKKSPVKLKKKAQSIMIPSAKIKYPDKALRNKNKQTNKNDPL